MNDELKSWRVLRIEDNELNESCIVRIRIEKPALLKGRRFDIAVLVSWTYQEGSRGLPDASTGERMNDFERDLDSLLGDNGFAELMVIRTGFNKREWLFYTSDQDKFMAKLNRQLANRACSPIEILFNKDPEWSLWNDIRADLHSRFTQETNLH